MPKYLSLNKVGKRYGNRWIFRNIDLEIDSNGLYGILGDNGVGKTTLIKVASGLLKPSEGNVYILGKKVGSGLDVKSSLNVLMHENIMYEELSVRENLEFYSKMYGLESYLQSDFLREVIDGLGLNRYLEYRLGDLSFGWKKRVNVARVFINNPALLLLDEPTIGLDMDATRMLVELLVKYSEENCVIFTVSDVDDLRQFHHYSGKDIKLFRLIGGGLESWSID